jgi:hypothetical protein
MDHREGYLEEAEQLTGELDRRWWFSDEGTVSLEQHDRSVDIIIGPDAETIEKVAAALQSG